MYVNRYVHCFDVDFDLYYLSDEDCDNDLTCMMVEVIFDPIFTYYLQKQIPK